MSLFDAMRKAMLESQLVWEDPVPMPPSAAALAREWADGEAALVEAHRRCEERSNVLQALRDRTIAAIEKERPDLVEASFKWDPKEGTMTIGRPRSEPSAAPRSPPDWVDALVKSMERDDA